MTCQVYNRVVLIVLAGFIAAVNAEESYYVCEALNVSELNDAGSLENTNYAKAVHMHEPKFAVDRATGIASGGPFGTWDAKNTEVLSKGTDKEAFKVLWLSNAPYPHIKYVMVKSYVKGEKKPFLGITGNIVITGMCE